MDNDVSAIQEVVQQLYASISFTAEFPPDWERLRGLFVGPGQLVRNLAQGPEMLTVDTFQVWVENARGTGLTTFHEEETDSSTHLMDTLAHRASHYRATVGGPQGGTIEGVNSIQLIQCNGGWKILSLAWDVPNPG